MSMVLWKKMLLKSDRNLDSAPVNVIFEHVPCGFVITQRIVPQDLLCIFFRVQSWSLAFYDNVIDANLVITRKVLLTWACANRRFDFWCWLSCCEVPSTQTQDNFVSDVSFRIIVTLAWFWLCKTWLFPWFVKYVIEIHVAKVALGVLHLNFLQIAPGQSTSFKLVDHSLTHNTSTQRARSYILISLNAHWCISEHMHRIISSDDARTHPAWRNWVVFPDAYTLYYRYILLCLVLACSELFSFSPSLFFRFSCLIFFSCWAFSRLDIRWKGF